MGILDKLGFGKLKEGLAKTREGLVGTVTRILTGAPRIDDELLEKLEESLIAADVGAGTAGEIIAGLRKRLKETPPDDASGVLPLLAAGGGRTAHCFRTVADGRSRLRCHRIVRMSFWSWVSMVWGRRPRSANLRAGTPRPGHKVLIAAADTFRAAAGEQLEIWAQRAGADIVQQKQGADPASVAFDAVKAATARKTDVVIIDTAGRLHTRTNLMEELKKIGRVIGKQYPAAPHEVLLIIDASTGQNGTAAGEAVQPGGRA